MGPNSREPWLFKLRSSEAFIIFVITVAMFTVRELNDSGDTITDCL